MNGFSMLRGMEQPYLYHHPLRHHFQPFPLTTTTTTTTTTTMLLLFSAATNQATKFAETKNP